MDFFDDLRERCPTIMPEGSLSCWCDCPAGWETLVRKLSCDLEVYAKTNGVDLRVDQIKSKFGGLRYYVSGGDETTDRMIHEAEQESLKTCEECGAPGARGQSKGGWRLTVCEAHDR